MKTTDLETRIRRSTLAMAAAAVADTSFTYANIVNLELGKSIEWNPIMQVLMDSCGEELGLIIPKLAIGYLAYNLAKVQGKTWLPYLATGVWSAGAIGNAIIYAHQMNYF